MNNVLLQVVNTVRVNKGLVALNTIRPEDDLRNNLGFDSLDLAELTVRLEKETGIDVFSESFVNTVGEILEKIEKR